MSTITIQHQKTVPEAFEVTYPVYSKHVLSGEYAHVIYYCWNGGDRKLYVEIHKKAGVEVEYSFGYDEQELWGTPDYILGKGMYRSTAEEFAKAMAIVGAEFDKSRKGWEHGVAAQGGQVELTPPVDEMHPVQVHHVRKLARISSKITRAAYEVYCQVCGPQPAIVTGECRGGFGVNELIAFLYARGFPREQWKTRFNEAIAGMEGF